MLITKIFAWRKDRYEKLHRYNLTFLHIKLPKDNEIEIKAAEEMFASISGIRRTGIKALFYPQHRISFEIVSKESGIGFYVVVPDEIAPAVEKHINGVYQGAEIDIINPHEVWDRGKYTKVAELKLRGQSFYPIKNYEDIKSDPLTSLTSAMSKMGKDEVLAVQYVVQPAKNNWRKAGLRFINHIKAKANNPEKHYNIDTSFLEGIQKKIGKVGLYTTIRLVSIADDSITAETHIQNIAATFEQFTDVSYNSFVRRRYWFSWWANKKLVDDFIYRKIHPRELFIPIFDIEISRNTPVLNIAELASIFHFPNKNVETPKIMWLQARKSSAPVNLPGEKDGIWIGRSEFRGVSKEVHMKDKDRTRHFYIIGQTGTGKSELLKYMALQDIRRGEGVCVIDPHGTDVRDLLDKCPAERIEDVIYFNVSDTERPMGLNMLEANSEEEKHMLVNAFIALLYKLYDPNHQGIMGPILERAIRNVMLTAMSDPESTMVDVMKLLVDEKYVEKYMDKIKDPMVVSYWKDEVAHTSQNRKSETMGYFVSKFDKLVTDKLMRNIIGQPKSAFNFKQVMEEKKILLVDLAKGKIGEENSNFIGLLLVPRILSAALSRHSMIEKGIKDFPPFYLYVDEFQNFATPDFETILSEARKYKLNLIVAHQFIAQLDEKIKEAIFGNVGSMCIFRVGAEDAEFIEKYFGPTFTAKDISNLPIGNAYIRLLVDGFPTPPFSMRIPWEVIDTNVKKDKEVSAKIIEYSRLKYGRPAEEVEAFINERMKPEPRPEIPEDPFMARPRIPF